jgi:hypothetical protein
MKKARITPGLFRTFEKTFFVCHCEQSDAIQKPYGTAWIASSLRSSL